MRLLDELQFYSDDVISGKVTACKKHIWACMRFMYDLERSKNHDPDFPYIFDSERAGENPEEKGRGGFLNWMRLFVHRKGPLRNQKIEPHIIQKFIFGNVYGWYDVETDLRRFTKMYWQVARKNAKSQSLSCVGSYETMAFLPKDEISEVYCVATKADQAKIVLKGAKQMLDKCDILSGKWKFSREKIIHIKTDSEMKALSDEDRRNGDGLNPQCGIIDEYHAHETTEAYDVIDSGMGMREQPLLCIITTAGFFLLHPCYSIEYSLVSKILNPDIPFDIPSYFAMVNELDKNESSETVTINGRKVPPGGIIDDIFDEKCWVKANPIVCSNEVGLRYLRKKVQEAKAAPEKMRNVLTKHFNIWVNNRHQGYMDMAAWAVCGVFDAEQLPDTQKMRPVAGFDMSSTIDLTSVSFIFDIDELYYVRSHSFMPEERVKEREDKDSMPYSLWAEQGWITLTPGAEVNYHTVLDWTIEEYKKNNWLKGEACFDRHLATWLEHELDKKKFTPIDIPQSYTGLSLATKEFRAKVLNRRIMHCNDPVLTMAMANAVTRKGPSENIMLDKAASKLRIDPAAATINAFVRVIANEKPKKKRGRIAIL